MDWPSPSSLKPVISIASAESVGFVMRNVAGGVPASAAYPVANLAYFVPLALPVPYLVRLVWWANGASTAGNVDVGVFSAGGGLILSAGSTAQTGTNVIQSVTLGTPVLLEPGSYYMALAASSVSATFFRESVGVRAGIMMGLAQQATAFPLATGFTLATYNQSVLPVFGIGKTTVI